MSESKKMSIQTLVPASFLGRLRSFRKDNRGVAALEFAIIAPILILLFLGTIEISLAISVDRKISRVSSAVADLVTQHEDQNFDTDYLNAMANIADRIMYPYDDELRISLAGIQIINNQPRVVWSWAKNTSKVAVGSSYTVPASIREDGTYLLAAKVETDHEPAFKFVNFENGKLSFDTAAIELGEEMFLRPRLFANQTCSNC